MRRLIPLLGMVPLLAQEGAPATIHLPSGLQATLWEDHDAALIRLEGLLPILPGEVPPDQVGLPTVLVSLLHASPKGNRSAAEFQALLDRSGIRLDFRLAPEGYRLSLACRSRDQELALGLLGDFLGRTPLDPDALEPLRLRLLRREAPAAVRAEAELLRGSLDLQPPESTLSRTTFADLLAFKARVFRPERLRLHLQGDLSRAQAAQRILLDLGAWQGQPEVLPAPAPAPLPTEVTVVTEGRGSVLAALPLPTPRDPRHALLSVLLEGRMQGRGTPGDPWRLHAEGTTAEQALAALEARMNGLTFSASEVAAAQEIWKGRLALLPLHPGSLLEARLQGLPETAGVARVTPADLDAALKALRLGMRRLWLGPAAWLPKPPAKP